MTTVQRLLGGIVRRSSAEHTEDCLLIDFNHSDCEADGEWDTM